MMDAPGRRAKKPPKASLGRLPSFSSPQLWGRPGGAPQDPRPPTLAEAPPSSPSPNYGGGRRGVPRTAPRPKSSLRNPPRLPGRGGFTFGDSSETEHPPDGFLLQKLSQEETHDPDPLSRTQSGARRRLLDRFACRRPDLRRTRSPPTASPASRACTDRGQTIAKCTNYCDCTVQGHRQPAEPRGIPRPLRRGRQEGAGPAPRPSRSSRPSPAPAAPKWRNRRHCRAVSSFRIDCPRAHGPGQTRAGEFRP